MFKLNGLYTMALDYRLFAFNTNVTTDGDLSDEMKDYYAKHLIDYAQPKLVHDQAAITEDIPKHGGKTIEFRGFEPLAKATTALTEGVTPDGLKLEAFTKTATIAQYGAYVALSDVILSTALDPMLLKANKELARQAGKTLDTISREVLNAGTSVQYADDSVAARHLLVGGESSGNLYLTPSDINKASTTLKGVDAPTVDGEYYLGIVHPHVSGDLREDDDWMNWNKYTNPEAMYKGEIGRIHGVRFVESTEAKVFHAEDLTADSRTLTFASNAAAVVTVDETLTSADQEAIVGRYVILEGTKFEVTAAGANSITLDATPTASDDDIIYPGEAGAKGRDVYSTLILGQGAYGTTKVDTLGLQSIIKQLGSGGTEDPLNQRSTAGWKATKVTKILIEIYMIRVETASRMEVGAAN